MSKDFGYGFDWRGVPLMVGQTVIYGGAGYNKSVDLVEAEVVELYTSKGQYPTPKVKLKVIRRMSQKSWETETVNVAQNRVTAIESLPKAQLPTVQVLNAEALRKRENMNSHSWGDNWKWSIANKHCDWCGRHGYEKTQESPCPNPQV